ncbi:MAG: UDP-3-O-(3-hydroxymyristoyl)glucosamine N-acyltransferase [Elusimicrobiaceae bacterium]|nr:UDP-3-O-(3-hydroxymyristoyl)glucosamine N-acyltransferase [Elusimicrobiaceae bacterium]
MINLTLKEIAKITGGKIKGKENFKITEICPITECGKHGICFLEKLENLPTLEKLTAGCVMIPEEAKKKDFKFSGNILYCENVKIAFMKLLKYVDKISDRHPKTVSSKAEISQKAKVSTTASIGAFSVIENGAEIGDNSIIYPNVYIGKDVKIGAGCIVYPNVVIREACALGNNVILQPGCVIGGDGFGYVFDGKMHQKIPQIGRVLIEDDVEIGANTTIDRATLKETFIGKNSKIDNLVQIGHNVKLGTSCIIISQTGIAGSVEVGQGTIISGQTAIKDHVKIGKFNTIGPRTGIMKDTKDKETLFGFPPTTPGEYFKIQAVVMKLPKIYKLLKKKFKDEL